MSVGLVSSSFRWICRSSLLEDGYVSDFVSDVGDQLFGEVGYCSDQREVSLNFGENGVDRCCCFFL